MSAPQPILEGKKEPPKEEDRKEKQSIEIETNAHLSLGAPIPSEEEKPSRDIEEKNTLEEKVEIHDQAQTIAVLEQQKASPAHAKKVVQERKRRQKADGKNGAQGTPAPDLLTQFSEKMDQKFEQILKVLHDVQRIRPLETANQSLQEPSSIQKVQQINVPSVQPDESIPVPYSKRVREKYPDLEPAQDPQAIFPRTSISPEEYTYFAKKFKQNNENIEFYDRDLRKRSSQDQSVGQKPSASSSSHSQVFMF
jgi:hypothetical protein